MKKTVLNINNTKCIQENYKGANAIYHAYLHSEHYPERQYTPGECEIELERVKRMELGIARTYFDLCAYEHGEWNWDNKKMQALYRWLGEMKDRGVEVALNAAWWIEGHIFGNEESPLYDKDPLKAADNYGAFVSEIVHQIIEVRGYTNVRYLVLLTEPNSGCWKLQHNHPSLPHYEAFELAARAAHKHLKHDGRRKLVKLVGPNQGVPDYGNPDMMEWAAKKLSDCIDIFTAHTYLDYKSDIVNWETHDGIGSLGFNVPGFRAQSFVKLTPHTDYELSVWVKAAEGSNTDNWERQFLFGAFEAIEVEGRLIAAGGEGVSALNPGSVATVPVGEITTEWKKHTMQFNTGDKNYAYIGIYHDILPFDATVFYDTVSLHKVGSAIELLENGDFEDRDSEAWLAFRGGLGYKNDKLQTYNCTKAILSRYLRRVPKGKEFWFDEYNARFYDIYEDPMQGIALAEMQAAFINMGVGSSFLWSLFDQYWPQCHWDGFDSFVDGDHRCGIMPVLKRSLTPYPSYYAFTLISKYMGDIGSRIYEGDAKDAVCASYVVDSRGNIGIMVVNAGDSECQVSLNLKKAVGKNLNRHTYTAETIWPNDRAEIPGIDKQFADVGTELTDKLPAHSVAIYTSRKD